MVAAPFTLAICLLAYANADQDITLTTTYTQAPEFDEVTSWAIEYKARIVAGQCSALIDVSKLCTLPWEIEAWSWQIIVEDVVVPFIRMRDMQLAEIRRPGACDTQAIVLTKVNCYRRTGITSL